MPSSEDDKHGAIDISVIGVALAAGLILIQALVSSAYGMLTCVSSSSTTSAIVLRHASLLSGLLNPGVRALIG